MVEIKIHEKTDYGPRLNDAYRALSFVGPSANVRGTVPTEYGSVEDGIASVAAKRDIVITTGRMSVGRKDHVLRAFRSLGDILNRVLICLGKLTAAARFREQNVAMFATPGKAVQCMYYRDTSNATILHRR